MKTLDCSLARFGNERAEIARRNERARAFCYEKSRAKARKELIKMVVIYTISVLIAAFVFLKAFNADYVYATSNGYVTETRCEVIEVDGETVIVEYKGEEYGFNGNGFEVGDKVQCKFNENMELINAK